MSNDISLYLSCREQIKTGDAILWQSKTFVGRVIQFFCNSPLNHVSIAIRFAKYDVDRVYVLESLNNGPVLLPLSIRLKKHSGHAWVYPLNKDFEPAIRPMAAWALFQQGKEYDYGTLFKNAVSRVLKDAKEFICSEYYQMALEDAVNKLFSKKSVPADQLLLMDQKLKKVYEKIPEKYTWIPSDWPMLKECGLFDEEFAIL